MPMFFFQICCSSYRSGRNCEYLSVVAFGRFGAHAVASSDVTALLENLEYSGRLIFYNKAFRHVQNLFIQGVCFYCTGSLLVGGIATTNSEPVQ